MISKISIPAVILSAGLFFSLSAGANSQFLERTEVQSFIDQASEQTGLPRDEVAALLGEARFQQSIIDAITRPAESRTWGEYRPIFITDKRIRDGVSFWNEHQELLEEISQDYGLSPEIIVAIIGVETAYGGFIGNYRVLDALVTLGFDYERRGEFFRGQLIEFIRLADEQGLDMDKARGSYAGAMGLPQFIPSSYRHYAVDGDGDGRIDLWGSKADIFASVANYFVAHGWGHGEPVAFKVDVADAQVDDLLNKARDLAPRATLGELRKRGVIIPNDAPEVPADFKVMLFTLTTDDKVEHWVGLNNFYVITRYNHSVLYAMAVWELATKIAALRES